MGLRCVSCRGQDGQGSAVLVVESCALRVVVLSPAGVEGEVGWMGGEIRGRADVSQSVNRPGMKNKGSVSQVSQQTDCQFAEQWASRARVETGRGQGRWDAQGPGACLLACSCSCSCPLPRCSCRPSGEQVAAQGRAACPWGLGPAPGSWRQTHWGLEPQLPFLVRQRASCLPQQNVNPGAWGVLSRRLRACPPPHHFVLDQIIYLAHRHAFCILMPLLTASLLSRLAGWLVVEADGPQLPYPSNVT